MRLLILGFAFGAWLLQMQEVLPARDVQVALAGTAAGSFAVTLMVAWWSANGATASAVRRTLLLLSLPCAGAASGFLYADAAAEQRMADELPPRFEAVDIAI